MPEPRPAAPAHPGQRLPGAAPQPGRLAPRSVGLAVSTVFSLASTAPAYSLAVTVGLLASLVAEATPLLLALSAVPVVLVVLAFGELNAAEPDCGTCYAWTSKPFGRRVGFLGGWVVIAACVLVMTNLMQAAAIYLYTVVGLDALADSRLAQAAAGIVLLVVMAGLASRGITLAARTQVVLFTVEAVLLVGFAVRAAAVDPLAPASPAGSPAAGVDLTTSGVVAAFLVAVFLYWGWDSSFSVNEESHDPAGTPVRAALAAMAVLVVLYAGFAWAVTSYAGVDRLVAVGEDDVLAVFATSLMGSAGGTVLAGAVLVSALASAQTTILPSARSMFSMSRRGDLPPALSRVSSHGSPAVATWVFTALAAFVYAVLVLTSEAVLADSVAATAMLVSSYYALTCAAVPFYFGRRGRAERPARRVVLPLTAAGTFTTALVLSVRDSSTTSLAAVAVVLGSGLAYLTLTHRSIRKQDR
ncbi:APC family permease [Nocardioides pantholopis]|uniref:APC family permease n=1 Tax=Nocardioides pantholopis TaxID=2483798 RepID=UPI000FD98D8E|nr:APC family permease [Nocardioides pantholopis]